MLEHSMRQKDGWKVKFCLNCLLGYTLALFEQHCFQLLLLASSISFSQDIEATIHCAEWLSIVGGSSTGEQRIRYFFFHVPLHLFFFFFTFLNDLFFLSHLWRSHLFKPFALSSILVFWTMSFLVTFSSWWYCTLVSLPICFEKYERSLSKFSYLLLFEGVRSHYQFLKDDFLVDC